MIIISRLQVLASSNIQFLLTYLFFSYLEVLSTVLAKL